MIGRGKPGPAPLPAAEKRSEAIALVKVTPGERRELEAWAKREGRPVAGLLPLQELLLQPNRLNLKSHWKGLYPMIKRFLSLRLF